MDKIRIGIAGVGGRPSDFLAAIKDSGIANINAICDINEEILEQRSAEIEGNIQTFTNFNEMIDSKQIDAVVIGTPMHYHAAQSIYALNHNVNVLSEVTAGVSLDECRELTLAVRKTSASYMMAENVNYMKNYMIVKNIVEAGLLGELYYAQSGYIHNVIDLLDKTPWRKKWHVGVNGNTYPTHNLGPILLWFGNDRVKSVSCAGSGHHLGKHKLEDTTIFSAKTEKGRLISIRLDLQSKRPHFTNFELQGTLGCYMTGRTVAEPHFIHTKETTDIEEWKNLEYYEKEFLPQIWKEHGEKAKKEGHNGCDYIMMLDYLNALYEGREMPIGIDHAMDMTLPALISQKSILNNGEWMDVPDSRMWV